MKEKKVSMSLIGIDEERAYSEESVWAYYRVPSTRYEFLDYDERESLARRIDSALAGLVTNAIKSVECQLIVTSSPLNVTDWAEQWKNRVTGWNPTDGFDAYVESMKGQLSDEDFTNKEVYLGVMLGKRGAANESGNVVNGFKATIQSLGSMIDSALGNKDYTVTADERKYWENRGRDISRILRAGALHAEPAAPEEIALLFKRALYPAMPSPTIDIEELQTWGEGEVSTLKESYIEKGRKFLKIVQTDDTGREMVGYRATLCFSHFPDELAFPEQEPWIHYAALLGAHFDMYSRFTLEPAAKVRKAVERKIAEIKDEAQNAAGTGGSIPLGIQERYQSATQLEHELSRDAEPWVYARHRIVVTATSEDSLRDRVQAVISHYGEMQIRLAWPTGDQMLLLQESQPADKVRVASYLQRQSLNIISGGMPTANSSVGDRRVDGKGWIGAYIGETTSRVREPVFFSPHAMIVRNSPPGVLITGSPGGGKSFTAFTLTCQMAMQGVWTIYIDPKADALPIQYLDGIGKINVFDLRNGNDGILDPFSIGVDESDKILLALETIRLLVGNLPNASMAILEPAITHVASGPNPSLNKVVDYLLDSKDPESLGLGSTLQLIRRLPFSRLCFAPQSTVNIRPQDGLTIVTLLGLDLPDSSTEPTDYTLPNRLAVGVMYLLTSFTRQLMMSMNQKHPKAVIIDEAWAVTSTASGQKVVNELARMGRSLNTVVAMVSQNAGDFTSSGLANSVSARFAFRTKSRAETDGVIDLLGLEDNLATREIIQNLNNGECLMQDLDGRVSRIQISDWNKDWKVAFDTNPETKGANQVSA